MQAHRRTKRGSATPAIQQRRKYHCGMCVSYEIVDGLHRRVSFLFITNGYMADKVQPHEPLYRLSTLLFILGDSHDCF